jgi:hypothetical protein
VAMQQYWYSSVHSPSSWKINAYQSHVKYLLLEYACHGNSDKTNIVLGTKIDGEFYCSLCAVEVHTNQIRNQHVHEMVDPPAWSSVEGFKNYR